MGIAGGGLSGPWALAAAVLLAAAALTSCGGDDAESGDAGEVPRGVVATVDGVSIGEAEFERNVAFTRRTYRGVDPKPTERELRREVLDKLITRTVIDRAARRRGLRVSPDEARAMFLRMKRSRSEAAFHKLLGPFTDEDLTKTLISAKLLQRLMATSGSTPLLDSLQDGSAAGDLPERWRSRVKCQDGYESGFCPR